VEPSTFGKLIGGNNGTYFKAINIMSNESKALTLSNEWLQPETIGRFIKGAPAILASLSKLKKAFSKSKTPKRDLKKIGDEIDVLQKDFNTLCVVMKKHVSSHTNFVSAFHTTFEKLIPWLLRLPHHTQRIQEFTTIVLGHEKRLKALETPATALKKKTKPVKNSKIKHVSRKARSK
jgi:hypothetical protein